VLRGHNDAGSFVEAGANNDLLDLVAKYILHELAKRLESCLLFLLLAFLFVGVIEIETLLCAREELLAVILLELLDHVLINGVDHVKDFKAALLEAFDEWRGSDSLAGLSSDVVDALLALLHAGDVVRHRIVADIVAAYERSSSATEASRAPTPKAQG